MPNVINQKVRDDNDIALGKEVLPGTHFTNDSFTNQVNDWAIIKINKPLGRKYGYLGWKSLPSSTLINKNREKLFFVGYWRGVVVYPTRSIDVGETPQYIELLRSERVVRIYLDELESSAQQSIGIGTVKLVIEPESSAATKARELINLVRQEIADDITQREFLELIETIIVPFMLSLGGTVEQIAEALGVDVKLVKLVAESTKTS